MPRKRLYRTDKFPYHLTSRVNNCEPFPLPLADTWHFITNELLLQTVTNGLEIHAFVLMPNHFHLIARFKEKPIDEVMKCFLSSFTRIINTRTKRSGHLFGARYHWSMIDNPIYYAHAVKYVYRNPIKGGLCETVEQWPYSTITGMLGFAALPLPVCYEALPIQRMVPEGLWNQLHWLNIKYEEAEHELIKKAFRRKVFKLAVKRHTRRPHVSLTEIDASPTPKGVRH